MLNKVKKKVNVSWRYIDDILFIKRISKWDWFFRLTIKFTADLSKEKVNFFDVEVTRNNGVLSTKLFVEPTDTNQFSDPSSCHAYHC